MSFQAYLDNIEAQTRQSIQDIIENGNKKGIFKHDLTATEWVTWCKETYQLGRGHAMALWKHLIEREVIKTSKTTLKVQKK
jgi:hypothetical protein